MICVVEGCTEDVIRPKGMCGPHYYRYSVYGDPLAPRPEPRVLRSLRSLIAIDTDHCVLWPHGITPSGYGKVRYQGRTTSAHRVSLELTVGPIPANKDVAAHSCRNKSCVNPRHLRWATHRENNVDDRRRDDTFVFGERNGLAILTEAKVHTIRSLRRDGLKPRRIGEIIGCSVPTVRDVLTGRTWRHVKGAA